MNLIEKWKNRETKRKLSEENIRLKEENRCLRSIPRANVCTIERNVQKVCGHFETGEKTLSIPEEYIKRDILRSMVDSLLPFIEYDFHDNGCGGKIYTGTLYVATGGRKYEH